jgi:hypothetical protein
MAIRIGMQRKIHPSTRLCTDLSLALYCPPEKQEKKSCVAIDRACVRNTDRSNETIKDATE